jgi:hypothetical protein
MNSFQPGGVLLQYLTILEVEAARWLTGVAGENLEKASPNNRPKVYLTTIT